MNYVVHPAEDSVVAIMRNHGPIRRKVRPIPPVLTLPVLAVLLIVLSDEPVLVSPDGLHDARPGVPNADITCFT
jgi:hypothetical protein